MENSRTRNIYFVILCGGSGTRLWPLSRKNRPKPLLPFLHNTSLLEQTIDRITPLAKNKYHIGVVTTQEQVPAIRKSVGSKIGFGIVEPSSQNTGPAILYSCLEIEKKDPNAVVVFLPADHFVPETEKFCSYIQKAIDHASVHDEIVTLGLMPTNPATGYGYIQAGEAHVGKTKVSNTCFEAGKAYRVSKFHEKPNLETAKSYLDKKNMFWNLGIFIGKVDTILQEYEEHAQEMVVCVATYHQTRQGYQTAPALSIDHAVMEHSENISVIPCDFTWNDVGNLDTFLSLQQKYNQEEAKNVITIDGKNNIAQTTKKLVSFIGVDNLCVIEDKDVLIIARRDQVEKVKEVRAKAEVNQKELV